MILLIGRRLPPAPRVGAEQRPWEEADPAWIRRCLRRALARPSGGWYVVDASSSLGTGPRRYVIDGRELVAWRAGGRALVAPLACPHMGADLSSGTIDGGDLCCPWHGLRLGPHGFGAWRPFPTLDDGVLLWVRLGPDLPTDAPFQAPRPNRFVASVLRMTARCDPEDVLANRLDPWHGPYLHPHSFARLRVLELGEDSVAVRVAYRVLGPVCVEVDAVFRAPDPRSVVMTIVCGDGAGSVVATHATPVRPGITSVVEAALATSDRPGFLVARRLARLLQPLLLRRARRLWDDDLAYAERRHALRATAPRS